MSNSKCVKQSRKVITKDPQDMTHEEKLKLIDDELNAFYKFCQQSGFTDEEMEIICQPLLMAMRRSWLQIFLRMTLIFTMIGVLLCMAGKIDVVGTHLTAIGRLLLIKLLPMWNWQSYYYNNCLFTNPFYNDYLVSEEDCMTCEALETIERLSDVRYRSLVDNYLNRDAPAIITDAMDSWAVMNTDYFWFNNITHVSRNRKGMEKERLEKYKRNKSSNEKTYNETNIDNVRPNYSGKPFERHNEFFQLSFDQLYLGNERLMETVPCALTSNLRLGSSDLAAFLRRVDSPEVAKWFVHWQNCEINAVKVLRKYYQRPYFLSSTVSPAHFNWVIMSSDYNSPSYKKVELDSGLIAMAQLRGATQLRLSPVSQCNNSCPELITDLYQGEILVFANLIWNLEYAPMRGLDNIAILTETAWEEDS